ncbi:hypothetical protein QP65_00150, partial [Staphylococcus aureus]
EELHGHQPARGIWRGIGRRRGGAAAAGRGAGGPGASRCDASGRFDPRLEARLRQPAHLRPGRRALPEPAARRRPSRSRHPEGRRGLLHDFLKLRFLSRPHHLAQPRPGELAAAQGRARPEHRRGLGREPGEAPG